MCAHSGNSVRYVVDRFLLPSNARWQWLRGKDARYFVSGVGETESYSAALAAFHEAEARLLVPGPDDGGHGNAPPVVIRPPAQKGLGDD